ncbi:MAG: hypothetical protein WDO15_07620 [Bacteroidota bacterium]
MAYTFHPFLFLHSNKFVGNHPRIVNTIVANLETGLMNDSVTVAFNDIEKSLAQVRCRYA